jgi:hypothetical protein
MFKILSLPLFFLFVTHIIYLPESLDIFLWKLCWFYLILNYFSAFQIMWFQVDNWLVFEFIDYFFSYHHQIVTRMQFLILGLSIHLLIFNELIYLTVWWSNPGPCTCKANTLPPSHIPSPFYNFFQKKLANVNFFCWHRIGIHNYEAKCEVWFMYTLHNDWPRVSSVYTTFNFLSFLDGKYSQNAFFQ